VVQIWGKEEFPSRGIMGEKREMSQGERVVRGENPGAVNQN